MKTLVRTLALAAACALAADAQGQASGKPVDRGDKPADAVMPPKDAEGKAGPARIYRWVDAEGKVHYGDRPPTGFKGEVTRVETEPERAPVPPWTAPAAAEPEASGARGSAPEDLAAKRRATRAQLEARLARARANVAAAKKALSDSEAPQDDERQVIQQRQAGGGMHGMAARSNCRAEVGKDGSKALMCPTSVPTAEYHERVARLEASLKKAEEELTEAERAWRRGVD